MYANPSIFKVSESLFFTDRIKQGSQIDVILLYSLGVSYLEVQEGLNISYLAYFIINLC